jgi:nickel-dependent lactate racemase
VDKPVIYVEIRNPGGMAMTRYTIPWGGSPLSFDLPEGWHVAGYLEPNRVQPVHDVDHAIMQSLDDPIGMAKLADLVTAESRVCIVMDDISRPTPVWKVVPQVIRRLTAAGVKKGNITIVPALGLHRPMTLEEIRKRTGIPDLSEGQCVHLACDDLESMIYLGTTSRGTPIHIARPVAEADLVISVGCIEPHIIASFGGGYKNILPGTAARVTIAHNHSLNATPDTFNMVGQPIEANPMRQDLEEGAAMLTPPVFIVNTVLDADLNLVRVVAGEPIQAHRAGCETSAKLFGVPVQSPADVVITNSFPMDSDLRQGVKALANNVRAVKKGGVMITMMRAEEGVGVFGLAEKKLPLGRGALRFLAPLLIALVPKLKLKSMGEEDRFFLYFALQAMRHATLIMVAPTIPEEVQENLPFVTFEKDLSAALAAARRAFPEKAEVLIFPNGGTTYPDFSR